MPLKPGYTTFHGVVLNSCDADHFRQLQRRLRTSIDRRNLVLTRSELQGIKEFAGDLEDYRTIFEIIRRQAADRWRSKFGVSWRQEVEELGLTDS
jgi:hypothetical protein